MRRPEREPEDRRLVEQRVEHACGAEARLEAARDAVDAALAADVLSEDERLGVMLEDVGERGVDRLREREPLVALARAHRRELPPRADGSRGASGRITSLGGLHLT